MSDANPKNKLVTDPGWQAVRQSMLKQWSTRPTWCCSQLRKYLGAIRTTSKDKIDVVMNYLTGTAFRVGRIKHPCISSLRKELSEERKRRKEKGI
jgi:hypothetical protein